MDSTRAQLICDQLLDDYRNRRKPSVPFPEAVEASVIQTRLDGWVLRLGDWLINNSDLRITHPLTYTQAAALWWFCSPDLYIDMFVHAIDRYELKGLLQDWMSLSVTDSIEALIHLSHRVSVESRSVYRSTTEVRG